MNINEKPVVTQMSDDDYIIVSVGGKLRRIKLGDIPLIKEIVTELTKVLRTE